MWSRLPPRFVARMLSGHAVVGLAASVLLYIVCLSGTVMVFHEEFERWEQPGAPEMAPGFEEISPQTVQQVANHALARAEERPHHFYVMLPVDDMPRMTATADETTWHANAAGDLVEEVHHPWTDFLTSLHYYLTLPAVLGLTLVGILGVLMTALVLSGVLSHPKLFRDAFKFRLRAGPRLRETDTHNRLAVWAMPFHLVVAFTGAALGIATIVAIVFSLTVFDGNVEDFFAPIFGEEVDGNQEPAPLADIPAALNNFRVKHPDLVPWYVTFHDPATAGQSAEILAQHPRRLVYGDNYYFDADGELTGSTGLATGDIGQQVAASLYTLHFGSFGGLLVKLAYGVLGTMATVVVASGVNIWLSKRRQRGRAAPVLERTWQATLWGTPLAMSVVMLLAVLDIGATNSHVATFWMLFTALTTVAGFTEKLSGAHMRMTTAGVLAATVVVHLFINIERFLSPAAFGISAGLILAAAWLAQDVLKKSEWRRGSRFAASGNRA